MKLNIVIPVLNEEKALQNGVEKTLKFLNTTELAGNFLITIADNGSTDRTKEIAEKLCNQYTNVQYLKISQRGVGLAFREAIKKNNCDLIGYMDVDLATDIKHLCQIYDVFKTEPVDIVVGSRLLPESRVFGRTIIREITSRALNIILKMLLKVGFTDAMCGFKFYRDSMAKHLVDICSMNNGWFYCAEMMIRAEWENNKVSEIPVEWHDDPDSKVKIGKLSTGYMKEIIKLYTEKNMRKKI